MSPPSATRAAAAIPIRLRAAHLAIEAGADGITAHLREDRRHISDADIARLKSELTRPLNLEMAATDEMLGIALRHVPNACCLVPEKREERTTEGGLDVVGGHNNLTRYVEALRGAGVRVSLFIEPDPEGDRGGGQSSGPISSSCTRASTARRHSRTMPLSVAREIERLATCGQDRRRRRAGGSRRSRTDVQHRRRRGAHSRGGGAQHRSFSYRRSDLRRLAFGDPAHAGAHGRGARHRPRPCRRH